MNREQANVIGAMTDEQLRAVDLAHYIDLRHVIVAFGEGKRIQFGYGGWKDLTSETIDFSHGSSFYRIATPKINFNGVEIDAPIKDWGDLPEWIWMPWFTSSGARPKKIYKEQITCLTGSEWATEEACQLYCKAHNKMMGVAVRHNTQHTTHNQQVTQK